MKSHCTIKPLYQLLIPLAVLLIPLYSAPTQEYQHPYATEYHEIMHQDHIGGKRKALEIDLTKFYADAIDKIKGIGLLDNSSLLLRIKNVLFLLCNPINTLGDEMLLLSPDRAPRLNHLVQTIAAAMHIRTPLIFTPVHKTLDNALSVAMDSSTGLIVLDKTVLTHLSENDLRGVIAHELAHIKMLHSLKSCILWLSAGCIAPIGTGYLTFKALAHTSLSRTESLCIALLSTVITYLITSEYIISPIYQAQELEADAVGARSINDAQALHTALESLSKRAEERLTNELQFLETELSSLKETQPREADAIKSMINSTMQTILPTIQTHPSNEKRAEHLAIVTL